MICFVVYFFLVGNLVWSGCLLIFNKWVEYKKIFGERKTGDLGMSFLYLFSFIGWLRFF